VLQQGRLAFLAVFPGHLGNLEIVVRLTSSRRATSRQVGARSVAQGRRLVAQPLCSSALINQGETACRPLHACSPVTMLSDAPWPGRNRLPQLHPDMPRP